MRMRSMIRRFLKDETGATAVEYGLIVAVISLAIVGGVGRAFNEIGYMFGNTNSKLEEAFN